MSDLKFLIFLKVQGKRQKHTKFNVSSNTVSHSLNIYKKQNLIQLNNF